MSALVITLRYSRQSLSVSISASFLRCSVLMIFRVRVSRHEVIRPLRSNTVCRCFAGFQRCPLRSRFSMILLPPLRPPGVSRQPLIDERTVSLNGLRRVNTYFTGVEILSKHWSFGGFLGVIQPLDRAGRVHSGGSKGMRLQ